MAHMNRFNRKHRKTLEIFLERQLDADKAKVNALKSLIHVAEIKAKVPTFRKKIKRIKKKTKEKAVQVFTFYKPPEYKPFECADGFAQKLRKKGFEDLGRGNFSWVLGHPSSDKVIKITHNEDNWIDYVTWASGKGYAGTISPKVFSYKRVKGSSSDFSVSVMERMEKTLRQVTYKEDMAVMKELIDYATHGNMAAMSLADLMVPGLGKFTQELKEQFSGSLDLHGGNIMLRKNGTLCVTDPVASCSKSETRTRLREKDFTATVH